VKHLIVQSPPAPAPRYLGPLRPKCLPQDPIPKHVQPVRDSGFRRAGDEICTPLRYYSVYCGNSVPTFRGNVWVPT
jgi:hypothetical protein